MRRNYITFLEDVVVGDPHELDPVLLRIPEGSNLALEVLKSLSGKEALKTHK